MNKAKAIAIVDESLLTIHQERLTIQALGGRVMEVK